MLWIRLHTGSMAGDRCLREEYSPSVGCSFVLVLNRSSESSGVEDPEQSRGLYEPPPICSSTMFLGSLARTPIAAPPYDRHCCHGDKIKKILKSGDTLLHSPPLSLYLRGQVPTHGLVICHLRPLALFLHPEDCPKRWMGLPHLFVPSAVETLEKNVLRMN